MTTIVFFNAVALVALSQPGTRQAGSLPGWQPGRTGCRIGCRNEVTSWQPARLATCQAGNKHCATCQAGTMHCATCQTGCQIVKICLITIFSRPSGEFSINLVNTVRLHIQSRPTTGWESGARLHRHSCVKLSNQTGCATCTCKTTVSPDFCQVAQPPNSSWMCNLMSGSFQIILSVQSGSWQCQIRLPVQPGTWQLPNPIVFATWQFLNPIVCAT